MNLFSSLCEKLASEIRIPLIILILTVPYIGVALARVRDEHNRVITVKGNSPRGNYRRPSICR